MRIYLTIFFLMVCLIIITLFFVNAERKIESVNTEYIVDNNQGTEAAIGDNYLKEINFEEDRFSVGWIKISDLSNLELYPNFSEKLTSRQASEKESCQFLVNGGFYSKDSTPIGLFISDGMKLNSEIASQVFNGFFSIDNKNDPGISYNLPKKGRLALQSGPVIIKNGVNQKISLEKDKRSRRIVLSITEEKDILFIVIFDNQSVYDGPTLEKLPKIIEFFEEIAEVNIIDAINLDGGTASSFYAPNIKLSELTFVGSYFCLKGLNN